MQSRIVCFVCGSLGGDFPLHSRTRESGAYFPFLEHHEPPKGCRLLRADGVVDSCRVCYAFLNQQWETYERSNTPAIKRLYWLKRIDDGQFTGAEMKLQGEYMAQVMGLQYQPACGDNCAPLSPDESTSYSRDGFGASSGRERKQQDFGEGVLDLSVPVKLDPAVRKSEKRSHSHEEEKSGAKSSHSKPSVDEYGFVCYTCGAENQGVVAKFITSQRHAEYDQFYPFLAKLSPPKGALPLNSQGICQVCDHCYSSLRHQWLSYEHHGTPNSARIFKVNGFFFSNDSSISMAASDDTQDNSVEVCYLCSQSYAQTKLCPLFTSSSSRGQDSQMYFPFIRELRRPNGARPLNPDGSVRVCINCFQNLQCQWQQYEVEKVSTLMRRYSLLPPTSSSQGHLIKTKSEPMSFMSSTEHFTKSPLQPLNIEISKTPEPSVKNSMHATPQFAVTTNSNNFSTLPPSSLELTHQQSSNFSDGKAPSGQPIPHPLLQAGDRPKKVCFICGEKCLIAEMHILYSYPAKHEAKTTGGQPQSVPFFPFLANREPAVRAEPMTEDGTVTACSYCFYSLLNQWRDFEESKNAADKNRWLRKYVTNEFVCFVCSLSVKRRKMRTLEVQKFQFLREHKAPSHGALVMWGGEAVGVCGPCHFSLTHQYAEYERLGVPRELRKYNWTVQNPAPTNENSCDGPENGQGQASSGNEDSNLSIDDAIGGGSEALLIPDVAVPAAVAANGVRLLEWPPSASFSKPDSQKGAMYSPNGSPSYLYAHLAQLSGLPTGYSGYFPASAMSTATGVPPGQASKPPFSLISPGAIAAAAASAGKLPLKTATVPPLNQVVSPSNGLPPSSRVACVSGNQTSSFAAALRKLAHQVKDPAEEVSLKSTQSPPAAHSPRSTTPKRSSHPLAFPSHTLPSTLPAPPVVTIAPTPAHHRSHSRTDSRQTADLMSSTPGLPYDMSSGKNDREHHPSLPSHSRDEDMAGSKDSPLSRTPSRLYPQVSSTPNGLSLTSQALDMYGVGYHPYRLEEEVAAHHGLSLPYGIDPAAYAAAAAAAAAYHPALLQQHPALMHNPFRLDDPLMLERYRLLQSPYFPFSMGAGLMPSQPTAGNVGVHSLLASAAAAGQRYPPELLQQHYQGLSPIHPLMDPRLAAQAALLERSRMEEDKVRDKEKERELEQKEKREYESERARLASHHSADRRDAGGHSQAERNKADLLTIPTRAVHPLERDERSHHRHHHHHHRHQDEPNDRGGRAGSPSLKYREAYQGVNLRSDRQSVMSPSKSVYPSHSHHPDHSHRKTSHPTVFSKDRHTAALSSHQPPLHSSLPGNSDHRVKPEVPDHQSSHGNSSLYNSLKHSSEGASPQSKVSYASSHNHVEKKPKPSELSRLFRPFDEPASSPTQKEEKLGESQHSDSSASLPYHLPPSSRLPGRPTTEGNSRFPLPAASSLHEAKTSDVLSIPVLRVQPQSHSTHGGRPLFPQSAEETKSSTSTSLPLSSSSSKPISHCINDRIERFDFKSLAREVTSSSSPAVSSECPVLHPAVSSECPALHPAAELHPAALLTSSSAFLEESRPRECMSKLDLEEKRQREADKNEFGVSSDEVDEEERMTARLTMIGRSTPLPLDAAEDKVEMLEAVGLTTRMKKKELLLKKEARRRKKQRLASTSPVLREVDQTEAFQGQGHSSRDKLHQCLLLDYNLMDPATLKEEPDTEEKAAFLKNLSLAPSSRSPRAESDNYLKRKYEEMTGPASSTLVTDVLTETTTKKKTTMEPSSDFPHFPRYGHGSRKHRAAPSNSLQQICPPDRHPIVSHSTLKPSVIFSNVDSWLQSNKGLAEKMYTSSSSRHQVHTSAGPQGKNGDAAPSSFPFPYLDRPKMEGPKLPCLPITVPSLPGHWNLDQNKTEKSSLKSTATSGHSSSGGRRDVRTAGSPFTHPVTAMLLEDKRRTDGEQSSSSYELSLPDLKRGFHSYR